ncbi:hypothetical protein JAAARDRAFT_77296 [Jaapia argillacea MUCL 33604]|uniref:Uncharacterized protein n=1 Tax=Jaapia argillacea MUCL 33604 TaxID=933084 RepID=A0A067PYW6_9AGAM|nr:hypothetical protein JAAARDRAFT_77296 [Jaapia argillacea MUCL 33604]
MARPVPIYPYDAANIPHFDNLRGSPDLRPNFNALHELYHISSRTTVLPLEDSRDWQRADHPPSPPLTSPRPSSSRQPSTGTSSSSDRSRGENREPPSSLRMGRTPSPPIADHRSQTSRSGGSHSSSEWTVPRYSFVPRGPNTMIVVDTNPENSSLQGGTPPQLYRITVGMNCFVPERSYITTIYRGYSNEDIAEIEIGNPDFGKKFGTVRIGATTAWISDVLKPGNGGHPTKAYGWKSSMLWEFPKMSPILWNTSEPSKMMCLLKERQDRGHGIDFFHVATFYPSRMKDDNGVKSKVPPMLAMFTPLSELVLDHLLHVLVSGLIVERKRLLK